MTTQQKHRDTAEDLYRAQCRRDGRDALAFDRLREYEQEKFHDRVVSGHTAVLQDWEGDHTDLVHVLWDANIKGEDADQLATAIRGSAYADARRAHDQLAILTRLESLLAAGTAPDEAIATLKNDLIGEAR